MASFLWFIWSSRFGPPKEAPGGGREAERSKSIPQRKVETWVISVKPFVGIHHVFVGC